MKKDITIPEVENVFLAAVQEWSDDFMEKVWFVYLVNDSDFQLDSVMVVSKAFGTIEGEMKKTSLLRHAFVEVPAVTFVKIEMVEKSVLVLNNEFMVTFFIGNIIIRPKIHFQSQFHHTRLCRGSTSFVCGWSYCEVKKTLNSSSI